MLSLQQVHTALHCCIALYRIALHRSLCTALYSTSLFCTALYCIRLHCTFHCSHLSGVRALARAPSLFFLIVRTLTPFPSFTPFLHSTPFPSILFVYSVSLLPSLPPSLSSLLPSLPPSFSPSLLLVPPPKPSLALLPPSLSLSLPSRLSDPRARGDTGRGH
jgi:hypothetical protein